MDDCVFCKIITGEIKSPILYDDGDFVIFRDIDPKAPVHLLAVPKRHYPGFTDMTVPDGERLSAFLAKLPDVAVDLGLQNGFRCVVNQGADAGQSVSHLHIHLLGGKRLAWPEL